MVAVLWLIGGIALIAAEVLSGDFFLLMVGIGALTGALSEWLFQNPFLSAAVFAVSSVGLVTFARPWLKAKLQSGDVLPTNVDALLGRKAVVLATVDQHGGQVKLDGEVWSARAFKTDSPIEPGTSVTVVEIAGATAVVLAEND